eukprot:tig00000189_g14314.t1
MYGGVANHWSMNAGGGPVVDWTLGKLNMDTYVYTVVHVAPAGGPWGRYGSIYATYGTKFYMYGGQGYDSNALYYQLAEMWAYDTETNLWEYAGTTPVNVPAGAANLLWGVAPTQYLPPELLLTPLNPPRKDTWVFVSGGGGSGLGPVTYPNWGLNTRVLVASPCPDQSSVVSCLLTTETAAVGFTFHCVLFPRLINNALPFPSCRLTANTTGLAVSQPTLASAEGAATAHAFRVTVEDPALLDPARDGLALGCAFSKGYTSKGGNFLQAFTDPGYVLKANCGNDTVNGTFIVPRGSTFTCTVAVTRTATGLPSPVDPLTTLVVGKGKLAPTLVSFANWTGAVASSTYTLSITVPPLTETGPGTVDLLYCPLGRDSYAGCAVTDRLSLSIVLVRAEERGEPRSMARARLPPGRPCSRPRASDAERYARTTA